nr:hypothetical protein [Tanacetum cinerariifolium]
MRSKRNIKPTKIFDNSVTSTSRNSNKQKNASKTSGNEIFHMDGTLDCTNESKGVCNNLGKVSGVILGEPMSCENDVMNIDREEDVKERENEVIIKDECNNGSKDDNDDQTCVKGKVDEEMISLQQNKSVDTGEKSVMGLEKEFCEARRMQSTMMWGKHGLGEMFCNDNEVYCFKFKHEEGMNFVLENSPWMVNGRPLIVQKWSPEVCLDKPEPDKVPLWVKMFDIPLKAWSHKGISKLASSIGKPLIMDEMTANMCQFGRGRISFARVLIEVDAKKPFKDRIDVQYRDKNRNIIRTKHIRIEYLWKPTVCDFCSVFGHSTKMCSKRPKTEEEKEQQKQDMARSEGYKDGYMDNRRKQFQQNNAHKRIPQNNNVKGRNKENKERNKGYNGNNVKYAYRPKQTDILEKEKKNNHNDEGSGRNINAEQKKEVDYFVQQELQPTPFETSKWSLEMVNYYKENWEMMVDKGSIEEDTEGVLEELNGNCVVMFCLVEIVQEKTKFLCSFVYAANKGKDRVELWKDLALQKQIVNGRLWVLLKDFNVTLHAHEHSAGSSVITQDMQDFKDCVSNNELEDICSLGFQYTWTKSPKNPKGGILKKLDREMSNEKFVIDYELAHAVFLPYIIFDHCPCLITIPNGLKKNGRTFRFINYIADKPEFIPIVKEEWKLNVKGFQMYRLVQKMKKLKKHMKRLNWKNGNLFTKALLLKETLKETQAMIDKDPFNSKIREEVANFLGVERLVQPMDEDDLMFIKKLDVVEASKMIKDITDKEIQEAMFDIDNDKASGPDGYTSCFFKKAWNTVGMDVCLAVKEFFQTGKLLKEINATIISLIPKLDTPNKVSDFRPIACCNVLYKCISKVLTNMIKSGLEKVVSINQSAFIPGRNIQDNILLTQELLKGYNRKNGPKRCALKIYLQKAYDTDDGRFKYHAGCKDLQMTHLCFADDLMWLRKLIVMKNFLWSHGGSNGGKAKIAWKVVCRPKDQGGLGIKPLREWNEMLLMKHIWKIVEQKKNLWVQWVNRVKLKGRNIWFMDIDDNDNWGWKMLMGLRDKMKRHVIYKIGNGLNTSVWFDKWNNYGPLSKCITKRDIYDARFKSNNSVAELIEEDRWNSDKVAWISKTGQQKIFSVKEAWKSVRTDDSIPHLFFQCSYYKKVWSNIKAMINLDQNINDDGRFKYHAGCKDLQMTHLCFADDLMVFCNGDVHSITVVKKYLNEFRRVSSLFPNLKKSTIFFGSVNGQVKQEILKIIDFTIGKLPMRYLGRFQLISSVLASMQTYWASVYVIPNTVIKEMYKVMKNFLWSHRGSNGGKAKIAWKVVCRPKDQGGLGIKPLREWNEILLMKHIWKIIDQKKNLWLGMKDAHGLRDKMKRHVIYKIGNGLNTYVWFDKWDHYGPLSNFITKRDIYDARFKTNNSVAQLIEEDKLKWPSEWLDMFPILKNTSSIFK